MSGTDINQKYQANTKSTVWQNIFCHFQSLEIEKNYLKITNKLIRLPQSCKLRLVISELPL